MAQEFFDACKNGDLPRVTGLYNLENSLIYQKDELSRNCLGVAINEGHWGLGMWLLRELKVSPHIIDANGESLYHLIARGLEKRPPTEADYQEVINDNKQSWIEDEIKETARLAEIRSQNPGINLYSRVIVKRADVLENEFFGDLSLFFPKYLLHKYHVVLDRKNSENKTPGDLAYDLGLQELGDYYEEQLEDSNKRRRLLQGLNDNLIKEIGSFY
jgi:hypothetical protein